MTRLDALFPLFLLLFSVVLGCRDYTPPVRMPDAGDTGWEVRDVAPDNPPDLIDSDLTDAIDEIGPDVIDDLDLVDADRDTTTEPTDPAEVIATGLGGFLLRGVVLAPSEVFDPGEVLVVGDTITCVDTDCSGLAHYDEVTVIETHGVISPSLIDAHNHIAYNFLPEWVPDPPQLFDNRYQWADDPDYEDHIAPYADHRSDTDVICPASKWAEMRSLVHGTTTVQGQSPLRTCANRLARNADHYHGLGYDHMRTDIASPRDIDDERAENLIDSFTDTTNPATRFAVHMCEGLTGNHVDEEFDSFAGRDPRDGYHNGISLLAAEDDSFRGVALLIHSMILTETQIEETIETGSYVVWSPSSNIVLYGETAPIGRFLEEGVTVAIGPDWTPSGEDDMLAEMRYGYDYGWQEGIEALTYERIWHMATDQGALAVGLQDYIGRLEVGYHADIAVFGRQGADPYQSVVESRAQDVRLVMVDGEAYYGDNNLEEATAVNDECEALDACGVAKFICVRNTPGATGGNAREGETMADVRSQLIDLLDGYGRADELNELIHCSQ